VLETILFKKWMNNSYYNSISVKMKWMQKKQYLKKKNKDKVMGSIKSARKS